MTSCASEERPWIVIVGGFLGAGKTSLILTAAGILEKRGVRSAIVLNDQGAELVDTRLAGLLSALGTENHFRGSMAGLCIPLSTLRRRPYERLRMTRGHCG